MLKSQETTKNTTEHTISIEDVEQAQQRTIAKQSNQIKTENLTSTAQTETEKVATGKEADVGNMSGSVIKIPTLIGEKEFAYTLLEQLTYLQKETIKFSSRIDKIREKLEAGPVPNIDKLALSYNSENKINIRGGNYKNGAKPIPNDKGPSSVGGRTNDDCASKNDDRKKTNTKIRDRIDRNTHNEFILTTNGNRTKHLQRYINNIVNQYIEDTNIATLKDEFTFYGGFDELQKHAELLESNGLGVIVEKELRVNHRNNTQSFVTMSTDRLTTLRDGMILTLNGRQHACNGDIVRAFVFNQSEQTVAVDDSSPPQDDGGGADDSSEVSSLENSVVAPANRTGKGPKAFVISIVKEVGDRLIIGTVNFFIIYNNGVKAFHIFKPIDLHYPYLKIHAESVKQLADYGHQTISNDPTKKPKTHFFFTALLLGTDRFGHSFAELKECLGEVNNLGSEINAIMRKNGFNANDVNYYKNLERVPVYNDIALTDKVILQREDLRKKCIFTIDPLTARDLDDALSFEVIGEDLFEVGVHISDVSAYLLENTELDNIVRGRATSIYLGNEVAHMLPVELCMKCSLLPGEDKLAFSVLWHMNSQGEIIGEPRIHRSVINSATQFAYEHAQRIIDGIGDGDDNTHANDFPRIYNDFNVADVAGRIRQLNAIARNLRRRRFENGSISINNPKLRFTYDNSGEPLTYAIEERGEANFMIEEFMLLANQEAARLTFKYYPDKALLRSHGPPLGKSMKALCEKLTKLNLRFDATSSKSMNESLRHLCSNADDPVAMEAFLNVVLTKPMARAKYFCPEGEDSAEAKWHYALCIPIYTHFTSPIRRYADIVVHRHIAAALKYCPPSVRSGSEISEIATICNDKKYNAKLAGDDCNYMYFCRYISAHKLIKKRVVVFEIFQNHLNAVTIDTGHTITITYSDQSSSVDANNAPDFIIIGAKMRVQLMNAFMVTIMVVDKTLVGFIEAGDLELNAKMPQQAKATNTAKNTVYTMNTKKLKNVKSGGRPHNY